MSKFDYQLFRAVEAARKKLLKMGKRVTVCAIKKELNIKGRDSAIYVCLRQLKEVQEAELTQIALAVFSRA